MDENRTVATIFFPNHHKLSSGFLIGFNYRGFLTCVVDVIPFCPVFYHIFIYKKDKTN